MVDALRAACLLQGDRVELALVQVRHRAVPWLLPQRLGCFQGVLEVVPEGQRWQMVNAVDSPEMPLCVKCLFLG